MKNLSRHVALSFLPVLALAGMASAQTVTQTMQVTVDSRQESGKPGALPGDVTVNVVQTGGPASENSKYQYAWRHDAQYKVRTRVSEMASTLRKIATDQKGDCIVVERANRLYLITDKYILDHASEAQAPLQEATRELKEQAHQQGEEARKAMASDPEMQNAKRQIVILKASGDTQGEQKLKDSVAAIAGDQANAVVLKLDAPMSKLIQAAKASDEKMTRLIDTAFVRGMAVEVPAPAAESKPGAAQPL